MPSICAEGFGKAALLHEVVWGQGIRAYLSHNSDISDSDVCRRAKYKHILHHPQQPWEPVLQKFDAQMMQQQS